MSSKPTDPHALPAQTPQTDDQAPVDAGIDAGGELVGGLGGGAGLAGASSSTENVPQLAAGLLGPTDIRGLARALGIRPTKVLGQNFVHDAGTVRRIVNAGGVQPGDEVLEVGPGLGSLTLALLEAGARVRAVEIDPLLARALAPTVRAHMPEAASRLLVLNKDALKVQPADLRPWPAPTRLVANLPYNVAVPVLLTLLERFVEITDVMVMVQSEVADRLAAGPGSRTYGVPSVKAAWYGQVARAGTISRSVFWPVPNVDSALVRLTRGPSRGDDQLRAATFEVVEVAFGQRRKTLRAALKVWAGSAKTAEQLLASAGIDPQTRGETLSVDTFVRLGACVLDMRAGGELPEREAAKNKQSDPAGVLPGERAELRPEETGETAANIAASDFAGAERHSDAPESDVKAKVEAERG